MNTILLRLEGPMQSWGIGSRFTDRHTEAEPTKSGVIGILCSALGRERQDSIEDLVQLKMGIRVDREGQILYDYHIALNILRANAKGKLPKSTLEVLQTVAETKLPTSKFGPLPSRRFYISDACFIVGLQSEDKNLLRQLIQSLKNPKWPLFLGRKSFLISSPICLTDNIIGKPLLYVLRQYPWQGRVFEEIPKTLRIIYECAPEEGEPRMDLPLSFATRKFRSRTVKTEFINSDQLLKEG